MSSSSETVLFSLSSSLSYLKVGRAGKPKGQVLLPNVREYLTISKVEKESLFIMKIYVLSDILDCIFSILNLTYVFTKSEYWLLEY